MATNGNDGTAEASATKTTTRRAVLRGTAVAAGLAGFAGSASAFSGDDGDISGSWDFPRATTRGHFDIHWWYGDQLTDGHTATDYDTVGDIPGWNTSSSPDEIMVSVHGWRNAPEDAPDHFATVKRSLRNNGYDAPVVGFSWDSDTSTDNWWPTTDIAERNGPKLANFLTDYAAQNPDTSVRINGHSLGARVVTECIKALNTWGVRDLLDSATLLGGAADNDSVAWDGEYGDDIAAAVGQFDNYWKSDDDVLNWAYSTGEFDSAVGEEGAEGDTPSNYADHNVDYVPDHFSYHEPGDGCMAEVVAEF
ncbi:DUF726 domain-containing protein [Halorussus ruber]|uniref:DUF726 domain-containing protein n=1 Tax=Halorussus ruber TaxID=1126238 RepID=UPI0010923CD7|nr:DUF726 domain-containing protein [Halorussus ruber]